MSNRISVDQFTQRYSALFDRRFATSGESPAKLEEKKQAAIAKSLAEMNVDQDQWITLDELVSPAGARMNNTLPQRWIQEALPNRLEKAKLRLLARTEFGLDAGAPTKIADKLTLGWDALKHFPERLWGC